MLRRRWLWLLAVCFLALLMCMLLAVSSIVFANSTDETLFRYPGCDSYQVSVWFYRDAANAFYPEHHSMAQRDRTEFRGVCIQLTLFRVTVDPISGPTTTPSDSDPRT